jgi:(p)ppGpp synthase/HD superfamily hydrolase
VQIRTEEMHRHAEEGIAAHWKYKEGRIGDHRDERYFQWMRQLLEVQQQQAVLVEARLKQEARIAELEAKLAVLEPYRTFVEQVRRDMQSQEHGGRWMTDDLGPGTHQT